MLVLRTNCRVEGVGSLSRTSGRCIGNPCRVCRTYPQANPEILANKLAFPHDESIKAVAVGISWEHHRRCSPTRGGVDIDGMSGGDDYLSKIGIEDVGFGRMAIQPKRTKRQAYCGNDHNGKCAK